MNKWNDQDAARTIIKYQPYGADLAMRIYTTQLLGQDPALVLHGGGNTSVKSTLKDELGKDIHVLFVKGSGWDMGAIEPPGMPAVALEPIRAFRALDSMSDEAMVNGVKRHLLDVSAPTPSVETLLHAFLPAKFIDHTHADAILTLADQPDAEEHCRRLYGKRLAVVPYIMPGFQLAKRAAEIFDEDPTVEGLFLIKHGIFTFGESAREAYSRMIQAVEEAEHYIAQAGPVPRIEPAPSFPKEEQHLVLNLLRGALTRHPDGIGSVILQQRRSAAIDAFLHHPQLEDLITRGTVTPDHVIRTKGAPLLLKRPESPSPESWKESIRSALDAYVAQYNGYFQRQVDKKQARRTKLQPLPVVFLIPGLGLLTMGKTDKDATIAGDIYCHTIKVIQDAEKLGSYRPVDEDDLFDMEYWPLEQAKLGKKSTRELEGKVALVTGATGGLGQAIAEAFAAKGCNLMLTDLAPQGLGMVSTQLAAKFKIKVAYLAGNLTDEAFCRSLLGQATMEFGGLDILVSNAGKAFIGKIKDATEQLQQSIAINLVAHQLVAAECTRTMEQQETGGCLLFNASKSTFNPGPEFGAYTIPKAGLIALMKQYAVEGAKYGIRANAVNADRIRTPLFQPEILEKRAQARGLDVDQYFKSNMLGQEVLAEDVAQGFLMLALAQKTTGATLPVDGGNIAAAPR